MRASDIESRYDERFIQMEAGEKEYFLDFSYVVKGTHVAEYKNATVTRGGVCLRNWMIVQDSIHLHRAKWPHLAATAYGSLLRRPLVRLGGDKKYIIIHNLWTGGYYHWVAEALPRALAASRLFPDATVLLPRSKALGGVMVESLQALGVRQIEWFPENSNVTVPSLVLPRNPPLINNYQPDEMWALRSIAVEASRHTKASAKSSRLFVSRGRSRARKISNEQEVTDFLASRGFETVYLEDHTFLQQVKMFQDAEFVIGQHGAGLVNLAFMKPGGQVLELIRRQGTARSDWNRLHQSSKLQAAYPKLAACMHVYYQCLLCEATNKDEDFDVGDIVVDCEALENKVNAAIARCRASN